MLVTSLISGLSAAVILGRASTSVLLQVHPCLTPYRLSSPSFKRILNLFLSALCQVALGSSRVKGECKSLDRGGGGDGRAIGLRLGLRAIRQVRLLGALFVSIWRNLNIAFLKVPCEIMNKFKSSFIFIFIDIDCNNTLNFIY